MQKPVQLSERERIAWLRLIRSENVGPITFRQLLARYGAVDEALSALPELARRGGRRQAIRIPSRAEAERELNALASIGARLVAMVEPDYPPALAQIDDAPPLLSLIGHSGLAHKPTLAIVGARNASAAGLKLAREIAHEVGLAGMVVVSGLARGIDTAAHHGALDSGTIAVLAGGVDIVYPPGNLDLYRKIGEVGLLAAEMPLGTEPVARHFPRRNRLISGIARAVLVVEAALQSGSLITARMAAEQGRDVLAIPGSPLDPRARGSNDLLRNGATLVETADDVLAALAGLPPLQEPGGEPPHPPAALLPADDDEVGVYRPVIAGLLGPVPTETDELLRQAGCSPAVALTILLELELAGRLHRLPGGRVSLVPEEE